jgi:hypothetical protein
MKISRTLASRVVYAKFLCIILLLLIAILPTINSSSYSLDPNFIVRTGIEGRSSSQPNLAVQCMNSPILPLELQSVNITANAFNGTVPIVVDLIEIFINNNTSLPVATISNSSTLNYTFRASPEIISYSCRVVENGRSIFSGWKTIRIDTRAIPIIYTREPNNSLDLYFIADNGSYSGPTDPDFLADVEKAIQMYYNETIFLRYQDMINFWISTVGGDAKGECVPEPPRYWSNLTFPEAGIILHRNNSVRDCALFGKDLFTANMAVEGRANITLLHETAHVLGEADEYEGLDGSQGAYFVNLNFSNIFDSQEACKQDELGKERECRRIGETNFFTSDTIPEDLMADNLKMQMLDERRIQWVFDCLRNTNNYTDCNDTSDSDKAIALDYIANNATGLTAADVVSSGVIPGEVGTNIANPPLLQAKLSDCAGNVIQTSNHWNAQWALNIKENGREALTILSNAEGRIVVPFDPTACTMEVSNIYAYDDEEDHVILVVDLAPTIRAFCEEFPDDPSCQGSDLAVVDVSTVGPQLSVLVGQSAEVTVSTTVVNNGPDAPIDAIVSSKAILSSSSSSGIRVTSISDSSQNGTIMTLALQNHYQHQQLYRIECLEPGTHTITFESQIAPLYAVVIDANKNNDMRNVSLQVDCSLNPSVGPILTPVLPGECPPGQELVGGVCQPICPPGQERLDGECVNPPGGGDDGTVCIQIFPPPPGCENNGGGGDDGGDDGTVCIQIFPPPPGCENNGGGGDDEEEEEQEEESEEEQQQSEEGGGEEQQQSEEGGGEEQQQSEEGGE